MKPAKLLTEQELIDKYWNSDEHKKWVELANNNISHETPVGHWICRVNTSDDVSWEYVRN